MIMQVQSTLLYLHTSKCTLRRLKYLHNVYTCMYMIMQATSKVRFLYVYTCMYMIMQVRLKYFSCMYILVCI